MKFRIELNGNGYFRVKHKGRLFWQRTFYSHHYRDDKLFSTPEKAKEAIQGKFEDWRAHQRSAQWTLVEEFEI